MQQSRGEPETLVKTKKLAAESMYHNLDPLVWLLGHANNAMAVVEGGEDDGSGRYQVSNVCPHQGILCRNPLTEELGKGCVASQGDGGISITYKGYVETNLTIPDIPQYNEDVLILVISDHKYRGRGTCANRYQGHRSFGYYYD